MLHHDNNPPFLDNPVFGKQIKELLIIFFNGVEIYLLSIVFYQFILPLYFSQREPTLLQH